MLKRYPGYFISLKGDVFYQAEDGTLEKLPAYKTSEKKTPFVLIPKGNHIEAVLITEDLMESMFPGGKMPEKGQGQGPANKPLLVFNVSDLKFRAEYATGKAFMQDNPSVGLTNGIPPVAQGKVRMLKGFHIFYKSEVEPYFGELNAKTDANGIVTAIDFPVALHESHGWVAGKARKQTKASAVLADAAATI